MKKIFEPLKLEIYYFDEKDVITQSFPQDENELPITGFDPESGDFV